MTADRCRCGHLAAQHYRDRRGQPMCVGTCGCTGYRPAEPTTPSTAPTTRGALARLRASTFVRRDLAASWQSALTVCGGLAVALVVLAFLHVGEDLGAFLYVASLGAH